MIAPHNNEKADRRHAKGIVPVTELGLREKGRIVYLQAKDRKEMQKLMSIGILPGMAVVLQQKFPSYVIALGQSQFAVDKGLASAIFVEKTK